ncbi:arsenate reductase ArsC [Thermodesulfatator atlanticus]|uniref:arsenate reductase ArsC n=1 Tax=Thermodesulfatator atlanticus TaxID=501497 RepID=UPI0003B4E772|nr:arsenate reductase ArsC [Thermodesulfatator atlanticus]
MKRVLFLCTENACRSQMAEALTNFFYPEEFKAFSAGIRPRGVNPLARQVLEEIGINTDQLRSKHLDEFMGQEFDLVVTLCDSAAENCPHFAKAKKTIHYPFPDPAKSSDLEAFRRVRDMIKEALPEILAKA